MTDLTPGYFEYDIVAGEDFKLTITVKENGILKDISGWSNFRTRPPRRSRMPLICATE